MAESSSPSPVAASATTLVVRTTSGWALTPPDGRDPIAVEVDALLELVRAGAGPTPAATRASVRLPHPLLAEAGIEPVSAFVAKVGGGCLVVEDPTGRPIALDDLDVRLLDAVDEPTVAHEVFARVRAQLGSRTPDDAELGARLRRVAEAIPLPLGPEPDAGHRPVDPDVTDEDRPDPTVPAGPSLLPVPRLRRVVRHAVPARMRKVARGAAVRAGRTDSRRSADGAPPAPADLPGPPRTGPGSPEPQATDEPATDEPATDEPASDEPATGGPATTRPTDGATEPADPDDGPRPDSYDPGSTSVDDSRAVPYLEPVLPAGYEGGPVPVYAVWKVDVGPALSLGMLTAAARAHDGGALNRSYEIRRPEDPASFLADLAARPGPAVLLCSNYVWSLEHNLDVARRAKELNPEVVVVHGGPSTPKYEGDAEAFFAEHGELVDVAVRGEGEVTVVELLAALATEAGALDLSRLAGVEGVSFRDPATGSVVRNPDRERVADLDQLPSPYLTGEFDHIPATAWDYVTLETNRGCPYGCTFCDWGSSTLSRIRRFSDERVAAEMDWAGRREYVCWALGDANFGIMSRDVETTETMVAVKERYGFPNTLGFNVAKNTTKHLTAIVDRLAGAGIAPVFTLALQTRDEATLDAVQRTNISTDHYVALAASLRRRGLPAQADIMIGLPGQTVQSLADDLQFLMDHEISARMWITQLLPNAPINDPDYRERWQVVHRDGVVVATTSFTEADRAEMLRIRHAYTVFERFGLLRHVVRFLQWDEGVPAVEVIRRVLAVADQTPTRYPLISWLLHYFDYFNVPPLGWRAFTDELRRCLVDEVGVRPSAQLDTVLSLQAFLMPSHGRRFPDSLALDHDYLGYFLEHTAHLWGSGEVPRPRPLAEHPPATFTIYGDPLDRCGPHGMQVVRDPREQTMTDDFWLSGQWELDSPLVVDYADVVGAGTYLGIHEKIPTDLPDEPVVASREERLAAVRVSLSSRSDPDEPA